MQRMARIANGLLLSLIFSTFQCIQSKIQQNNCVYLFFQDMYRLIFIFLFSSIITPFKNFSVKMNSLFCSNFLCWLGLPINCDSCFGANKCTISTSRTVVFDQFNKAVALIIEMCGEPKSILRA